MRKSVKIDRIARKHGAWFCSPNMPEGPRYWFSAPNRGEPFDSATAKAVLTECTAAGLWPIK
jgi:hypothetical protein